MAFGSCPRLLLLASSSLSHCCWVFYVHLRKQCSAKVYNYALIVVAKWKDEAVQYDEKIMLNFVVCFDQNVLIIFGNFKVN